MNGLTPRQMQVAGLVAVEGLTRKEAAVRLGITPGGVGLHLARIYARTGTGRGTGHGAESRALLARWLRQEDQAPGSGRSAAGPGGCFP